MLIVSICARCSVAYTGWIMKHTADGLQDQTAASSSRNRAVAARCLITDRQRCFLSPEHTMRALSRAELRGDERQSVLAGGMDGDAAGHHPVHGIGCSGRSDVSVGACWLAGSRWSEVPYKEDTGRPEKGKQCRRVFLLLRLLLLVNLIETADITAASLWLQLLATYFLILLLSLMGTRN